MAAAALLVIVIAILCSPLIAREMRRIAVSIASELKTLKDDVAALHATPAPAPMVDMTDIHAAIDGLTAKVDSMTALVGTPAELNPPA